MPNIDGIFNRYQQLVGTLGGDIFNVYRPNYNQVNGTPRLIAQNVKFRCDPTGQRFAEPKYAGVNYYDIFGPRSIVQTGDILKIATVDNMTPPITIATIFPVKSMIGFRTGQIGYLEYAPSEGATEVLYTNVLFDFVDTTYPGSPLVKNLADSLKIPQVKAILYSRSNILALGTHLVQQFPNLITNPEGQTYPYVRRWAIESIDTSGPETILSLRNVG